ncbi:glycosyltransferase [Lacinutrix sp. MedPE-SW]|uniref:glycosyltransferase family 2 protein n=1 Tax=Lacinutrix sp. MedPE-SW TaxID=1860087 RepID=UPI00091A064E|nr:glycosyltransferase [Lacinutrix sp. MedPE-SW]OIQ22725.1 MAG: hypothetical protein BM549_06500 [Lacinutrix sp. MedPE-SW]
MKPKQPLISVVLPVYNVERYIKEALDSVLKQTIQDFEILVIDDCSTDDTIKIVEAYNEDRIKIVRKEENKGLIHSLNLGFGFARGKYIARMDGDDINNLTRFEKQLQVLENQPQIIACGSWVQYFGSHNTIIKHRKNHDAIVAQMLIKCPMSLGCCMLRTTAVKSIMFNKDKIHVEDYDFWSRIAWSGKLYNIPEILYYYRSHENQVSTLYKKMQQQGDILIQLFLYKKIRYDESKFNDVMLSKFIQRKGSISIKELQLFISWQKKILSLNNKSEVFNSKELKNILHTTKRAVIYNIYFVNGFKGINKEWRLKALLKLPVEDFFYVTKKKIKERIKILFN